MVAPDITKIGVIGAGQMGSGIAHVCALAGHAVALFDVAPAQLDAAAQAGAPVVATFPGQGSQYSGMGKKLYDKYDFAKQIYKEANMILEYKITNISFSDDKKLNNTKYTQPAVFIYSYIADYILKDTGCKGFTISIIQIELYS